MSAQLEKLITLENESFFIGSERQVLQDQSAIYEIRSVAGRG